LREYGELVSWPILVPSRKNSTLLMVAPEAAVAVAVMGILASAANVALLAGPVMLTVGGGGVPTVTLIVDDVVVSVRLSVATAVSA
jgi:hypothetical protein